MECCGVVCTACEYYPRDCPGCRSVGGKPFWTAYTGQDLCDIYRCGALKRKRPNCGGCPELPCARYGLEDPTRTHEENEAGLREQLKRLRGGEGAETI